MQRPGSILHACCGSSQAPGMPGTIRRERKLAPARAELLHVLKQYNQEVVRVV
jgi:hypothetical protein